MSQFDPLRTFTAADGGGSPYPLAGPRVELDL